MKIAISSNGEDLTSEIDPRFGRCAYFLFIETNDMSFEACSNESNTLGGGAGIQSAQFIASKGAQVVLTGNCGQNAVRTLNAANIKLIAGQTGSVQQSVESYINGVLTETTKPTVPGHYGMSNTSPFPKKTRQGMGMGRKMAGGRGAGRGMGRI